MQKSIYNQAEQFLKKRHKWKLWQKVVSAMGCVVVFCTVYALILPALTMEGTAYCGQEEHVHTDACYTAGETSYKKEQICSVTGVAHMHTDICYDSKGALVCTLEEVGTHTHTGTCYEEVPVETASEETTGQDNENENASDETESSATETVTERKLICAQPELSEHVHSEACFETVETIGARVLACQETEHTHTKACYANPKADVETEAVWEKTFEDVTLTGDYAVDVLAIAASQLGYTESSANYIMEGETQQGYTRYGAWYGVPYGEWCAMYVSFCLNYAEVEGMPLEAGCQNWINKLQSEAYDLYVDLSDEENANYIPQPGDLIFFNLDSEPDSDHVGIVTEYIAETEENAAVVKTIEGNSYYKVRLDEYEADDASIMGYGKLPEQIFYCGSTGHVHTEECYDSAGKLCCEVVEHIHTEKCSELEELSPEEQETVDAVISAIEALPTMEEFSVKLQEFEDAEDMEGYEAYYEEIREQVLSIYALYEELDAVLQGQITNVEKLKAFEVFWTESTLGIEQGIEVYQINNYSVAKTMLLYGKSAAEVGINMRFSSWTAIVVEEKKDGTLYVSNIAVEGNKDTYKAVSKRGFVLLVWKDFIPAAELGLEVGDVVQASFDYTQTFKHTGDSCGTVSFTSLSAEQKGFKTVTSADTLDLITVNLYDYSSNINDKYNTNKKYPGFQQDKGQLEISTSEDKKPTKDSNFGNNITADLTAGLSGVTVQAGTNINAIVKDQNGAYANRPNSGMMSLSLGSDGYPALKDGTSLKYLFNKDGGYANKKNTANINGLFRYDVATGAYTFNSRENHAQFDASTNTFTLYKQWISSNAIWYPFGNFLPFNDITTQCTAASEMDRAYFEKIASRSGQKYIETGKQEYQTLATVLTTWIGKMDAEYPDGWGCAQAMNEYFNSSVGDKNFDFSKKTELLSTVYSIDYDVETDFYFGMEMYMEFMQPKDGMTGTTGTEPMEFYFTGDDDVWIYVDGKLFLDLSGIHRHVGGKIDFVNGTVAYYGLDVRTGDVSTEPYKTQSFEEILGTKEGLNSKGTFENYSEHTMNFYYMERGAGSGVCRMNFNLPLLHQNSISVTKELSVDDENSVALLGNPDFKFQVFKAGGNELLVGANVTYNIYNAAGMKVGTGITDEHGIITIKAGQKAVIGGILENEGKYYVRELLDNKVFEQYGKVTVDGTTTTTDSYTNVEIGEDEFHGVNSSVKDVSDGSTMFTFNNNVTVKKTGELHITKRVEGDNLGGEFKFKVELDEGLLPVGTVYAVTSEDGMKRAVSVEEPGIIQLQDGETATISNILAGSKYKVQELSASSEGYTVQYSGGILKSDQEGNSYVEGYVSTGQVVAVTVTNIEKGTNISILGTKTLANADGEVHKYQINLTEVTDQSGMTEVPGGFAQSVEAAFPSENNEISFTFNIPYKEKMIAEFPATFYYKIAENVDASDWKTQYDQTVYVVKVMVVRNEAGNLEAKVSEFWKDGKQLEDTDWSLAFNNSQLYDLTIVKKYVGGTENLEKTFKFEVSANVRDGVYHATRKGANSVADLSEQIIFSEGKAIIELKADEALVIHGLPYDTVWSVTETSAQGYKVTYQIEDGEEIEASNTPNQDLHQSAAVTFTNYMQYQLPESGGIGTTLFIIGGLALMSAAGILLYNKSHRREGKAS